MKNLFIISEEEKKRILGLHQSATKRQYLSEQNGTSDSEWKQTLPCIFNNPKKIKGAFGGAGGTTYTIGNTLYFIKDGKGVARNQEKGPNFGKETPYSCPGTNKTAADVETNQLTECEKYDNPTSGKVQMATKSMKACDTQRQFKNTPCVTQKLSQRGVSDGGDVYYLFKGMRIYGKTKTYPDKGGISKNSDTAMIEHFFTCSDIEKYLPGFSKSGGVGDPSSCPVGNRKAIMAFQDWLDGSVSGWLPNYPEGVKKDPKRGYGSCGPNTRKAWAKYGEQYSYKSTPPKIDNTTINQTDTSDKQSTPVNATRGGSGMGQMALDDIDNQI